MLALCLAMVEPEEQEAFTAFFDRHYKPVLYKACKILKNRENAEDVTQEIFLYAADHFEKFHGRKDAEIRRYLMECTESRAVDMLRRRNGAPEKADEGEVARAATDDTEQIVLRQDTMTRLLRCIDELDAPCRAALKLRMAGVPAEEAAQMLGISREAFTNGHSAAMLFYAKGWCARMHYEEQTVSLRTLIQWGLEEDTERRIAALPPLQEIEALLGIPRRSAGGFWKPRRTCCAPGAAANGICCASFGKTLTAAAILVSLLFCVLMANASVRAAVVNTIIEWTDRSVGIRFEMTGTPLTNLPEGYGPHYIPEGMIYQDDVSWKVNDQISYSYVSEDGTSAVDIQITIANNSSGYWMDNEHILYDRITFSGETAYLGTFKNGTGYVMLWVNGGIEIYIYYIGSEASLSELYHIAENIY